MKNPYRRTEAPVKLFSVSINGKVKKFESVIHLEAGDTLEVSYSSKEAIEVHGIRVMGKYATGQPFHDEMEVIERGS